MKALSSLSAFNNPVLDIGLTVNLKISLLFVVSTTESRDDEGDTRSEESRVYNPVDLFFNNAPPLISPAPSGNNNISSKL